MQELTGRPFRYPNALQALTWLHGRLGRPLGRKRPVSPRTLDTVQAGDRVSDRASVLRTVLAGLFNATHEFVVPPGLLALAGDEDRLIDMLDDMLAAWDRLAARLNSQVDDTWPNGVLPALELFALRGGLHLGALSALAGTEPIDLFSTARFHRDAAVLVRVAFQLEPDAPLPARDEIVRVLNARVRREDGGKGVAVNTIRRYLGDDQLPLDNFRFEALERFIELATARLPREARPQVAGLRLAMRWQIALLRARHDLLSAMGGGPQAQKDWDAAHKLFLDTQRLVIASLHDATSLRQMIGGYSSAAVGEAPAPGSPCLVLLVAIEKVAADHGVQARIEGGDEVLGPPGSIARRYIEAIVSGWDARPEALAAVRRAVAETWFTAPSPAFFDFLAARGGSPLLPLRFGLGLDTAKVLADGHRRVLVSDCLRAAARNDHDRAVADVWRFLSYDGVGDLDVGAALDRMFVSRDDVPVSELLATLSESTLVGALLADLPDDHIRRLDPRVVPEADTRATSALARARIHHLRGEKAESARYVSRGIELDPYYGPARLFAMQLTSEEVLRNHQRWVTLERAAADLALSEKVDAVRAQLIDLWLTTMRTIRRLAEAFPTQAFDLRYLALELETDFALADHAAIMQLAPERQGDLRPAAVDALAVAAAGLEAWVAAYPDHGRAWSGLARVRRALSREGWVHAERQARHLGVRETAGGAGAQDGSNRDD